MNKVITIGREFGSGGRELGKRISEHLQIAYYDKEIVTEISKRTELAEEYVQSIVENKPRIHFPITIGNSFYPVFNPVVEYSNNIYVEQNNTLKEMVERSDCVIIGRCADYILKDYSPFKIFVYADMQFKIQRCMNNASESENLSEKELRRRILEIDRNRARYYEFITDKRWGDKNNYDLCVNTSRGSISKIAKFIANVFM